MPDWLPDLDGTIVGGEPLRHWALSEVWRIRLAGVTRKSVITKRGVSERGGEAQRYRELVVPLGIPAPELLSEGAPGVMVLEDLGGDTLDERPTMEGFEEAARGLARMRAAAAPRLAAEPSIGAGLRTTTADFMAIAGRAQKALTDLRPELAGALDDPVRALRSRLERLAGEPPTIVHADYQAKNLLHTAGGGIIAIDWSDAYVHAHLGDLFLLLREGRQHETIDGIRMEALPELFAHEAGTDLRTVTDQLVTGGLCHSMIALCWVVETAVPVDPMFADWIDGLVTDCQELAS